MRRQDGLFKKRPLSTVVEGQLRAMRKEIESLTAADLARFDDEMLVRRIVGNYRLAPIVLNEGKTQSSTEEVTADTTVIRLYVPFSGEASLFDCFPSTLTSTVPSGRVERSELVFEYASRNPDPDDIKARFDSDLGQVKTYLGFITNDLAATEVDMGVEARKLIEARRQKVKRDDDTLDALGFPRRSSTDQP